MELLDRKEASADAATLDSSLGEAIQERSIAVLIEAGLLQAGERDGFEHYLTTTKTPPGKLLSVMAELRQIESDQKATKVEEWGRKMAPILKQRLPLVPFAARLFTSDAIFEKHPKLKEWCEEAGCPLIFAEDADVIGLGQINPVAGQILSQKIDDYFRNLGGVIPFLSNFLITHDAWTFLTNKQFGS